VLFYDWGQGLGISHDAIQVVNNGTDPDSRAKGATGSLVDAHTNSHYHAIWTLYPYNSYPQTTAIFEYHITV